MPEHTRYNKAIDLLEQGKTVFASGLVWNGNLDDLTFIADSDYNSPSSKWGRPWIRSIEVKWSD